MALTIDEDGVAWHTSELGPEIAAETGYVKADPAEAVRMLCGYDIKTMSGKQLEVADAYLTKHDPDYISHTRTN